MLFIVGRSGRILSEIHPLWFLFIYLVAIPTFGLLYNVATPHGFRLSYARSGATSDIADLGSILEAALRRSFARRAEDEFVIGTQKLSLDSLRDSLHVDSVNSNDGTTLSFRVSISAEGIVDFEGERHLGWSMLVTVPEQATSAILGPSSVDVYRSPEVDFSQYASPFREQNEKLFALVFSQRNYGFGILSPAMALTYQEDLQLRDYLQTVRQSGADIGGDVWRMLCLSATVMTTLGSNDIVPSTWRARMLIASQATVAIVLAGLFLNAVAFRAAMRRERTSN